MSPAQVARRLERIAGEITACRLPAVARRAEDVRSAGAIPLGIAVAALLHTVSGDVRARAAQACSVTAEPAP